MKPLFHQQTIKSLASFLRADQHAAIIASPSMAGLKQLIEDSAQQLLQAYVTVPISPNGSSISIEQIRQLKQSFSLRQVATQERLLVVEAAEKMTLEAQNSFLKLLEEPPEGVKILLLTAKLSSLLPTIRSRAALVSLQSIGLPQAVSHYTAEGVDEQSIKKSYAIADGQPSALYALLSENDNTYIEAIEQAKVLLRQPVFERLLAIDSLSKDKEQVALVITALHDVLRAATRTAAKQSSKGVDSLVKKRRTVLEARQSMERNVNTKLLLTDVFLNI